MQYAYIILCVWRGWGVNADKPSSVAPHASFAWPTLYVALKIGTHQSK